MQHLLRPSQKYLAFISLTFAQIRCWWLCLRWHPTASTCICPDMSWCWCILLISSGTLSLAHSTQRPPWNRLRLQQQWIQLPKGNILQKLCDTYHPATHKQPNQWFVWQAIQTVKETTLLPAVNLKDNTENW